MDHEGHTMAKVTEQSILELEDQLKRSMAKRDHEETSKEERQVCHEEIKQLDQKIKYDKLVLGEGNTIGKNKQPIIGTGTGYEITVNL